MSGKNESMTVNFDASGGAKSQAPLMKAFIMFRCGHKFHKSCIREKVRQKELEQHTENNPIE